MVVEESHLMPLRVDGKIINLRLPLADEHIHGTRGLRRGVIRKNSFEIVEGFGQQVAVTCAQQHPARGDIGHRQQHPESVLIRAVEAGLSPAV